MLSTPLPLDRLLAWIRGDLPVPARSPEELSTVLLVDLDEPLVAGRKPPPVLPPGLMAVVVGRTEQGGAHDHPLAGLCDVVVDAGDPALDAILATVEANPLAAVALVLLLRGAAERSVDDGLLAESATYSALQGGPELAAWRERRPIRDRPAEDRNPVVLDRTGQVLRITLDRPHVRNALNTAMRDALVDAFALVRADAGVTEVHLHGTGPSFCAGGDLDEFGSFPDAATAHAIRLQRSVGRAIHAVRGRVTAHLHGACAGSGIELPAFAGRVVAHSATRISLPELTLGLVPGAGGTVSLPRRIGRWRTARLALTREELDAPTALAWGLVDEIDDEVERPH